MIPSPRVSIIIPTLQEEKLIRRALGQFTPELKRRYGLEVIVSDGGSTDRTVDLARCGADTIIENGNGSPQNISIGRNHGAEAARGEILMFFNADVLIADPDLFFPRMIAAIRDRKVAAATCNVLIYPEEEGTIDRLFHGCFNRYCRFLNTWGMGMGRGECHVIRREVLRQIGGYNSRMAAGEDYELFVRLKHTGSIHFDRTLTVYESPRRYRKLGYAAVLALWFLNGLTAFAFHRSIVKKWKPVR